MLISRSLHSLVFRWLLAMVFHGIAVLPNPAWAQERGANLESKAFHPNDLPLPVALPPKTPSQVGTDQGTWIDSVDSFFGKYLVKPLAAVLFFDFGTEKWLGVSVPFVVMWLLCAGIFLTLRMGFINFRLFRHAIDLVRGKYDDADHRGDITHFQALSSALSGTVGLGNIAGVAMAIGLGGPGATAWLIFFGLIGMTTKFAECSLAVMYRTTDSKGMVLGGDRKSVV